jgi:hypothetical protein
MYKLYPSLVLGFHACARHTAETLLSLTNPDEMKPSVNNYDWLGHGVYFWENSPERARQYAQDRKIENPEVVGAVLHLGRCLDFTNFESLGVLKAAYYNFKRFNKNVGYPMPENNKGKDRLLRNLDCAVIEYFHTLCKVQDKPQYDTVRGVFWEGRTLYPNAGFKEKNHIQICVRNPECIKGLFRPLEKPANSWF